MKYLTLVALIGFFVMSAQASEKIDIINYSNGLYILMLNSGITIKFIKN